MIGDERSLNINKQDVVYKRKGNRICESVLTKNNVYTFWNVRRTRLKPHDVYNLLK